MASRTIMNLDADSGGVFVLAHTEFRSSPLAIQGSARMTPKYRSKKMVYAEIATPKGLSGNEFAEKLRRNLIWNFKILSDRSLSFEHAWLRRT
jgi:hypothetical protein